MKRILFVVAAWCLLALSPAAADDMDEGLSVQEAGLPEYMEATSYNDFTGWTYFRHSDAGSSRIFETFDPYVGVHEDGQRSLSIASYYQGWEWIHFNTVYYIAHQPDGGKIRGSYPVDTSGKQTDSWIMKRSIFGYPDLRIEESLVELVAVRENAAATVEAVNETLIPDILSAVMLEVRLAGDAGHWDVTFEADKLAVVQETVLAFLGSDEPATARLYEPPEPEEPPASSADDDDDRDDDWYD